VIINLKKKEMFRIQPYGALRLFPWGKN